MTTVKLNLDRVIDHTLRNGGGTFSPVPGGSSPTSGYAVAIPGRELKVPIRGLSPIQVREILADKLADFTGVTGHRAILAVTGHYVGTWVFDGQVYLDVVEVIHDRDSAIRAAKLREEIAIFNLATRETITL